MIFGPSGNVHDPQESLALHNRALTKIKGRSSKVSKIQDRESPKFPNLEISKFKDFTTPKIHRFHGPVPASEKARAEESLRSVLSNLSLLGGYFLNRFKKGESEICPQKNSN